MHRMTFNQALNLADDVRCLVRGADGLVGIKISKAAARRDYASAVKDYKAFRSVSDLSNDVDYIARQGENGPTLWSFDPSDRTLLIG